MHLYPPHRTLIIILTVQKIILRNHSSTNRRSSRQADTQRYTSTAKYIRIASQTNVYCVHTISSFTYSVFTCLYLLPAFNFPACDCQAEQLGRGGEGEKPLGSLPRTQWCRPYIGNQMKKVFFQKLISFSSQSDYF